MQIIMVKIQNTMLQSPMHIGPLTISFILSSMKLYSQSTLVDSLFELVPYVCARTLNFLEGAYASIVYIVIIKIYKILLVVFVFNCFVRIITCVYAYNFSDQRFLSKFLTLGHHEAFGQEQHTCSMHFLRVWTNVAQELKF